jgi:hypothetical protein
MGEWMHISTIFGYALGGDDLSASCPDRIAIEDIAPGTHWIGGWVDRRAGLDYVKKRKSLALTGN